MFVVFYNVNLYICVFMACSHSAVMTISDHGIVMYVCMHECTALSLLYHDVQNANRYARCLILICYGTHGRWTVLDPEANEIVKEITSIHSLSGRIPYTFRSHSVQS